MDGIFQKHTVPDRFYFLDAMRGLAALVVVIYHYPQFFFSQSLATGNSGISGDHAYVAFYTSDKMPFSQLLSVFYENGWLAVDLFFGLSGFIFYWLFALQIESQTLSFRSFSIHRFSRLYPLHFLTLIWVTVLLFISMATHIDFDFYDHDDWTNFFLNLTFTSSWGLGDWHSFNTPIWSVSVEVMLYIMFFSLSRYFSIKSAVLVLVAFFGLFFVYRINHQIGHGMFSFFMGGATYHIYGWIVSTNRIKTVTHLIIVLCGMMWILGIIGVYRQWSPLETIPIFWRYTFIPAIVIFQTTILSLSLVETRWKKIGNGLSVLGDISYSVYLIHFPLQITMLILVSYFRKSQDIFYNPYAFFSFFAILFMLSIVSHYCFERPIQRYIRRILL
jgi:peptidoglycan/LPS O-acetylase OafA/YrhL